MSDKKNEYRNKKKLTKTNMKNAQRAKTFRMDEDSILNSLPSGAFESVKEHETFISPNEEINEKIIIKEKNIKNEINEINEIDEIDETDKIDEEEFNESYFEPTVYVKK